MAKKSRDKALLGAAVVKAVLKKRDPAVEAATQSLYDGILRDLGLTDAEVETYLEEHAAEVEEAIRSHGRRG